MGILPNSVGSRSEPVGVEFRERTSWTVVTLHECLRKCRSLAQHVFRSCVAHFKHEFTLVVKVFECSENLSPLDVAIKSGLWGYPFNRSYHMFSAWRILALASTTRAR